MLLRLGSASAGMHHQAGKRGTARHRRIWTLIACVLPLGVACSGCGPTSRDGATPSPVLSSRHSTQAPLSCPARGFSRMTEAQRVGQLFLVGLVGDPVSEVTRAVAAYHFGSWLLG